MANKRVAKIRETYREVDPDVEYRFKIYFDVSTKERTLVEIMGVPIEFIEKHQRLLGKMKIKKGNIYYGTLRALTLYCIYNGNGNGLEEKL